uniref:Guanine nucleotide-binding protein subunit alpha n=1 Tax=Globodera pallida TaxID=36090 RepID=A0A183BZA5_GLOPA
MFGFGRFNVLYDAENDSQGRRGEGSNKQNGGFGRDGGNKLRRAKKEKKDDPRQRRVQSTIESALAFLEQQEGHDNERNVASLDLSAIVCRINSYVLMLPAPGPEDGILFLKQGTDFNFCKQFVETIQYGADFFKGMIVKNFTVFERGFFNILFKHLAKTPFPQKVVPLLSFRLPLTLPWPHTNYLTEVPRHMEPKVLRKRDLLHPAKIECEVSDLSWPGSGSEIIAASKFILDNGFAFVGAPPSPSEPAEVLRATTQPLRTFDAHSSGTGARVMYKLRNEPTNTTFYVKMWLIDVGGQKTERRKWIHCFDSVSAILYVVSLSCYDQFMEEDPSINRMKDSIELFRAMFFNQFLIRSSFILFFNKKDLFEKKLRHVPLHKFYPTFEDRTKNITDDDQYAEAVEFMKKLFMDVNKPEKNRHIYAHITNATDTMNIEFVFGATCDIVLQNNLTRSGMT